MVDVQQPPIRQLDLPKTMPDYYPDEKRARELAQAYWEYLMNFYDIWGCWPWEWPFVRRTKEYVYERDPKQAARDRLEYIRARNQLRTEAEIEAEIERTTQNREEAEARFEMIRYLHTIAPEMRRRMEAAKTESAQEGVLDELVKDCGRRFPNIEIVPPHLRAQLRNGAYLETFLRSGYDQVLARWDQMRTNDDRAELVTELLAHDKGYPRLVNMANNFIPFAMRTVDNVLLSYLHGFTNINIFTGKPDDRTPAEQIQAAAKLGLSSSDRFAIWQRIFGELARRFRLTTSQAFLAFMERNGTALANALNGVLPDHEIEQGSAYVDPIADLIFPEVSDEPEPAEARYELAYNAFSMQFRVDAARAYRGQFQVGDVLEHPTNGASYRITQVGNGTTNYKLERID